MTWVRKEDDQPLHPKFLRLSDGAYRLWDHGLAFANRGVTDGRIDKALVASLNHHGRWTKRQLDGFISELLAAVAPSTSGLWVDCGDHYQIHDYEHHQAEAMKARVDRRRGYEREKKARQREDKDRRTTGKPVGVPPRVPEGVPTGQPSGHTPVSPREGLREASVPSRPVPNYSLTTFESDAHGTGPIVGGIDPESVRAAYLARWDAHAKGKRPPLVARGFGSPVWSELAQAFVDRETTTQILDAAFVDPFVRSTGWTPKAILGAMPRLSTADVRRNDTENPANGPGEGEGSGEATESILGALRARHDEELLLAEKCALRGDVDGKLRHTAEAARLRVEWRQTRDNARKVAS